jgi:transcriptional regulator with XRE-family HTH domain
MARRPGIPVRQRRVSNELRALRKKAGLTCKEVAEALGMSITKVSRMETGARGLYVDDVAALLGLYRVPARKREELLALVREGANRNWQQLQTGKLPTSWQDVIRFEAEAELMYSFEPQLVPGLLQTPEYARAIIRGANVELTNEETDMLVSARMTRHAILAKPDAPVLHAVIDEAVLSRPVGGPGVMRRQLQHLIASASAPNITLRVLPLRPAPRLGSPAPCSSWSMSISPTWSIWSTGRTRRSSKTSSMSSGLGWPCGACVTPRWHPPIPCGSLPAQLTGCHEEHAMALVRAVWCKSSRSSDQGNCVEVAFAADTESAKIAVRDSKNMPGPALVFPAAAWTQFRSSGLVS